MGRKKMLIVKHQEVHVEKDDKIAPSVALLSPVPLKTFDGGFFTLSSPAARQLGLREGRINCQTTRTVGRKVHVTRSVTASARRTASLLSPFMSRSGKLSTTTREELELPSRCRFLLDDMDSSLNTTEEEFAGDASETVVDVTSAMTNCRLSAAAP